MGDMEIVRQFNSELSTIYETKPPISKAKVASVTRLAVKAIKYYKHVVQSIEKFAQKCRQEYKIPALYVIDSVIRQSRHQFGADKDVYGPRFAKNIMPTFQEIFKCVPEEQGKVVKVLNLWQKSGIYSPEIIQPLLSMPATMTEDDQLPTTETNLDSETVLTQPEIQAAPSGNNQFVSILEEQRLEHQQQIQQLQQQLQEQQRINQQQQQQLQQTQLLPGQHGMPPQAGYQVPPPSQVVPDPATGMPQPPGNGGPPPVGEQQPPKFQLQPEVFAQIQALTGMNIRMPQPVPNQDSGSNSQSDDSGTFQPMGGGPGGPDLSEIPGYPGGSELGPKPGMPPWAPQGIVPCGIPPPHQIQLPPQGHPRDVQRKSSVIDDFDYGEDDDDASRIAEQRRHLMEEERRLNQEILPPAGDKQDEFMSKFRPIGEAHDRHPDPAGPFDRHSTERHSRDRSPGGHRRRSQSPRRRSRSPRWRDRSPRRRSRSPSGRERGDRERDRDRDKDRGRNRDRDRDRDRDHDRDKDRGRGGNREVEKRREWIPMPVKETLSVCSTTIWVGHVAKTVMKENLHEMFEDQGQVSSVDMVPPRGCAYVVMVHRQDASRVLVSLRNARLHSNVVKLAWAPGKGVKGREYKEYFDTNLGVTYIPWDKLGSNVDFQSLAEGGWIDPETLPPSAQENNLKEGSEVSSGDAASAKEDKDLGTMSQEDLMKLAAAQANAEEKGPEQGPPLNQLGQPPPHIPPPGPHMFPPGPHHMIPPQMMMQPPFPGGPPPPNMMPPGGPPPNMGGPPMQQFLPLGAPPGGSHNGPQGPPHHLGRPQEGGQFPPQSGRSQDGGRFPPPGRPQDGGQFPPPGRPQDGGQFPPQHLLRPPQDGGQFPPHHPGRMPPDGQFPPHHPGAPPFHQRPPHHMGMPPFHPGGPRFSHDLPPLMPSGGPPRGPEFRPHGPGPWGPGPGPMRGPPPHGMPPPGWPENRPPEDPDAIGNWNEQPNSDEDEDAFKAEEEDGNVAERQHEERDLGRRRWREHDDRERDRGRDRNRELERDNERGGRDDRSRDRDDRARDRDREDRPRDRDRERDRERDRDRERNRGRDREDRRRERDEHRSNKDVNGEREGSKRRSRFEPVDVEKPSLTTEVVTGEGDHDANSVKKDEPVEPAEAIAPPTIPQNTAENELSAREEGEIIDGNDSETVNIPKEDENVSTTEQSIKDDSPKLSNPEIKVDGEIEQACS